jgi:metal-responsive CopG/Arc/MetJ family transcriptional regulator
MATVKTAVSVQESLFRKVDALANELQISRSRLFSLAIEEYLERHQSQRLLREINAAYDDMPDQEEQEVLQRMRRKQRQLASKQW